MGHFQILESARICVLEYKRKPIEMTEFQCTLLDCGCKGSETFGICKASGNKKH